MADVFSPLLFALEQSTSPQDPSSLQEATNLLLSFEDYPKYSYALIVSDTSSIDV